MQFWNICRLTSTIFAAAGCAAAWQAPPPPATRVEVVVDRMHGVDIPDPYRWLEDQQSLETRAWIKAQNAYTRSILDAVPGRDRIRAQLDKLYPADFKTAPVIRHGRYFYRRVGVGQQQLAICMREGIDGAERVLVDPAPLSPDASVSVQIVNVTPDGRLLAWAKRKGGEDESEVYFLDVDTGKILPDHLPRGTYYKVFVLPDKSGFLYSRRRSEGSRILEHRFGTPVDSDSELFGDGLPDEKVIFAEFSEDGRFAAAFVVEGATARVYVLDRSNHRGFEALITDLPGAFSGSFGGHTLFLRTTWKAENGRVLAIDLEHPARESWHEVVPEPKDSVLLDVVPVGHKLAISFLHNVIRRVAVFDVDGKPVRDIPVPTAGSAYIASGEWDSEDVFYLFSSFAHPNTIYHLNLHTGAQSVWHKPDIPVDSDSIATTQIWYTSKDGTRVPMFLVSRKGTQPDGNLPVLLEAYGGYGAVKPPLFSSEAAMWVERGGLFAWASIRGGGEFGEPWHRDGMLDKKQNSFDDFIAAAEWLIANKYTRPERLAIEGASNGGLLVGAVTIQRPELFRAVICGYPHLDMLRYHKFLKAAPWVKEYGNPDIADEFAYLRKYSPYQLVRNGARYPAMLFTTGDGDTRVAPLHARKMTARMQAATKSGLPVLLRYGLLAGHSGSGSRSNSLDNSTDELAFLFSQLGLKP